MENISIKSVLKFTAVIIVVYFFHFVPVGCCDTLIMNNNVDVKSKPVVIAASNSVIMKTHLKTGKIKITKKDK